ncbi:hypothetical protein K488DRAFT_52875 [Vararia minispora EC-137]|uniref:Uncharacterized protein n=1 Tax=Vararia minispora EC-137 TaxID=1314806 RepID=A0ACB8QHJ3_9AGAM|nr:hypothetical protein K488DRAFT_52875 [Vararia minispora EC-137]
MRTAGRLVLALSALRGVYADAAWQVYYPKDSNVIAATLPTTTVTTTASAASATQTVAAYNMTELVAPSLPSPMPSLAFGVQLYSGGMENLSIQQNGAFMGFSIEMSVSVQVCASAIHPTFLNLMANLAQRAGWVRVRVGGNSQETAELKTTLAGYSEGTILAKDTGNTTNPTNTPPIEYTSDLFTMMGKITDFTNIRWYLGVPFYTIDPVNMDIVVVGESVLGDRVLAYQVANEPDYYGYNGRNHRDSTYSPANFTTEFGEFITQVNANSSITRRSDTWMVPSISATNWNIDDFITTGLISTYKDQLYAMTVERYPNDNCGAIYGYTTVTDPQDVIASYVNHDQVTSILQYYQVSSAYAVSLDVPYIMFETNTASCSGFPGVSDAFAAALWGIDWSMTLAYYNFSAALYHIGGQAAYYNAFTPPPTAQSAYYGWTVGPIYYSALVLAETMGSSNTSQVVELFQNSNSPYTPGWAVYENGIPKKVLMINYMTDSTGSSDYTASVAIGGGTTGQTAATPSSVKVKILRAASVASKTNMTWAGQTLGDHFTSDGRLTGDLSVQTIQCDTTNNVCKVVVPAPGAALIFLDDDSYTAVTPTTTETFPTTFYTATVNTAKIDPSALAHSNGHGNMSGILDATSQNSRSSAWSWRVDIVRLITTCSVFIGAFVVWM